MRQNAFFIIVDVVKCFGQQIAKILIVLGDEVLVYDIRSLLPIKWINT